MHRKLPFKLTGLVRLALQVEEAVESAMDEIAAQTKSELLAPLAAGLWSTGTATN